MDMPDRASFPNLCQQINTLRNAEAQEAQAGHRDLAPGLWLSTDPAGTGVLACAPGKDHFKITLKAADTGRWAALGLGLSIEKLRTARYFGLLIKGGAATPLALTPALRFHFKDAPATDIQATPVILAGTPRQQLAFIPIPADLADRAHGSDCNLFFQSGEGSAEIQTLEPVLIN